MALQSQQIVIPNIPSGRLPSPLVNIGLLRFLPQARGAVRVLFAHRLSIRQILRAVTHHDQRSDLGSIDGHVCEDAGSVWDLLLLSGGHLEYRAGECLVYTPERERVRDTGPLCTVARGLRVRFG